MTHQSQISDGHIFFQRKTQPTKMRCALLANRGVKAASGIDSLRKVCSIIVYSVRIGSSQPKLLLSQSLPQTLQPSEFVTFAVKKFPVDALGK
jgi:hypothetical protein